MNSFARRKCSSCKKMCAEWEFFHKLVDVCKACARRGGGDAERGKKTRGKYLAKRMRDHV